MPDSTTREELVARMRRIRRGIEEIFIDTDYWNEYVRKPSVVPIDIDPDGKLRSLANAFDQALAKEDELKAR